VIPEQLYRQRFRPLRATLPAFEPGVSTVRFRTTETAVRGFLPHFDTTPRRVSYAGETFRARLARSTE
jgi:hypothetical protein